MGSDAFRDKVSYYESNKALVHYLTYEERIDVDLDYLLCLFEIGKYHKFLSKVDSSIELVIMDNIFFFNEVNIYNDLLFKKAACLYNTGQYKKSEQMLKSILKLEPTNDSARMLFGKCKRKQGRDWYESTKAIAVVMFLSAFGIAIAELLIIKPFYNEFAPTFSMLKFTCFIVGMLALIANELFLRFTIAKEIGYTFKWNIFKF